MKPDDVTRTISVLNEVIIRWPDFALSRIKGTHRFIQSADTGDSRKQTEGVGLGSIPALVHLDILDDMAQILVTADLLHEHIAATISHPPLAHPASAYADPRPYLRYIVALLPEACDTDDEMLEVAAEKASDMRALILVKLGEVYDGQVLEAICPFCIGQTFRTPAGEKTLRVRIVPSRIHEGQSEFVVVCENGDGCHVMAAECSMWVHGRPAWPWSEWEWLAKRLLPTRRQLGQLTSYPQGVTR